MRTTLLLIAAAATGCTTHNRLAAGSTYNIDGSSFGGEGSVTGATGDDGMFLVASASARAGHDRNGGSLLFGAETARFGSQVGARITATIGPAFVGQPDGAIDVTGEVRGGLSVFKLFDTQANVGEREAKHTLGLELYVSSIGFDSEGTMLGLALTVGRVHSDEWRSIAASRATRRHRHLARR